MENNEMSIELKLTKNGSVEMEGQGNSSKMISMLLTGVDIVVSDLKKEKKSDDDEKNEYMDNYLKRIEHAAYLAIDSIFGNKKDEVLDDNENKHENI